MKKLNGVVVVITGASSGVGRAAALEFARQGAIVLLAARREEALADVVAECEELGAKASYLKADVTDADAMKRLAQAAIDFGGRMDVWVNNAGVLAAGPFEETPANVHEQVIKINLIGYINGAHAALPYFKLQARGVLINNISVGGWFPTPYAVGYTASKFGLCGFSEALRGELHQWPNIHVCDLFPAFLDTPGIQHAGNYTGHLLRPAPPVYDPQRVAKAMVNLALHPQKAVSIGGAAPLLLMAHALFPGLSRRITAKMVETYLDKAAPAPATSGNLFEPVPYGTGIYGGWQTATGNRKKLMKGALLFAGMIAGILLLRQKV